MAGRYYTAEVQKDYLKDLRSTGSGQNLSASELARSERFADAVVDGAFAEYDRSGWVGSVPAEIEHIASLAVGHLCQGILNIRDDADYREGRSLADWLERQYTELILKIKNRGNIPLLDGTNQYPDDDYLSTVEVHVSTPALIVGDAELYAFYTDLKAERPFQRAANLYPYQLPPN